MLHYDIIATLGCTCLLSDWAVTTKLQGYLAFCEVTTHPQSSVCNPCAREGGGEVAYSLPAARSVCEPLLRTAPEAGGHI